MMEKLYARVCRNPLLLLLVLLVVIHCLPVNIMAHSSSCSAKGSGSVIPLISFLEEIQETALDSFGPKNYDPKYYVDLSLKYNLSITQNAFAKLPRTKDGRVPAKYLQAFIGEYFNGAGDDLVQHEPVDFVAEPQGFLPKVKHPEVRAWALQVHALWKNLSRKVSQRVKDQPELHTLLPLPKPCIIPGSRFREVYYWDSYWVIRGLLASKMHETAKAIVTNLIYLIENHGFVFNGARAYYSNRSQPPLLSSMIHEIYKRTGDISLVKKSLPALLKEHEFWNSGIHKVTVRDSKGCRHNLSRYYAMWNKPRPESSTIDKETASKLPTAAEKEIFYHELASAAESGWDFSTRWMRNSSDLTTLATTSIIPVDLNAYILKMELDIASLAKATGEKNIAARFLEASEARQRAFRSVFWNEKMSQWLDCWVHERPTCEDGQALENWHQNQNVFASNFIPLWLEPFDSVEMAEKVMKSLRNSGLVCAAGIATSLTESGQQWDYPNGWAPLQHIIIEALLKSGSEEAKSMAKDLAFRWIRTNYVAYKDTGEMHEKYNVKKCGDSGGGGEYVPQTGFGWTNGVVLALLEEFGWPKDEKLACR